MDVMDTLIECKLCHARMKEPKVLSCHHTFCGGCLEDHVKKCNGGELKCPTCSVTFEENGVKTNDFIAILLNLKTCGVCEKKESVWFCQECDQCLCILCAECHNKMKCTKKHNIVLLKDEEVNTQIRERFYCDTIFESDSLDSHDKHEVKREKECIEERVNKLENNVRKIKCFEMFTENHLQKFEKEWMDKRKEVLEYKDSVRSNYLELVEALKCKESLEYGEVDGELSRIEKEFLGHKKKIDKDIASLSDKRERIENSIEEVKSGLKEGYQDEFSIELPQMHTLPSLDHHLSFEAIPKEAVSQFQACIFKTTRQCTGKYASESKQSFEVNPKVTAIYSDDEWIYACYKDEYHSNYKVGMYSSDTFRQFSILKFPQGFEPSNIISLNKCQYVIGLDKAIMLKLTNYGLKTDKIALPSTPRHLSKTGSGKIIITSNHHLWLYDPERKIIKGVLKPAGYELFASWCLGDGNYVLKAYKDKVFCIIRIVIGRVQNSVAISQSDRICVDTSGFVYMLDASNNVSILNKDLNKVLSFHAGISDNVQMQLHTDSKFNIRVFSVDFSNNCHVCKYKMLGHTTKYLFFVWHDFVWQILRDLF